MWRFRQSIVVKLALFVSSLLVLIALAMNGVAYIVSYNFVQEQIYNQLEVVAADRRKMILAYVAQQHERAALLASRTKLRDKVELHLAGILDARTLRRETRPILLDALKSAEGFLAIWIADVNGNVVTATHDEYIGRNYAADPDFQQGKNHRHVGELKPDGDEFVLYLTAPVSTNDNRKLGVVMVLLNAKPLVEILLDRHGLGKTGEVLVAKREGEFAHYLVPPQGSQQTKTRLVNVPMMANAIAGKEGIQESAYDGIPVLAQYQPITYQLPEYQRWGLIAKIDAREAYAPVYGLGLILIILESALLIVGLICSYLLARRFTKPILELTETARTVAAGNLEARVAVRSTDEIGLLAATFNQMTAHMAASHKMLQKRVEERTVELAEQNNVLRDTQTVLVQQEKLASLGQLAAGIAHEINNPLSYVSSNVIVLRREFNSIMSLLKKYRAGRNAIAGAQPELADEIDQMEDDCDIEWINANLPRLLTTCTNGLVRVRDIVKNLLEFAHLDEAQLKELCLNEAVDSTTEVLRHELLKNQITLKKHYGELPPVMCCPGKINQVLLNLLINAIHASQPSDTIEVRTRCEDQFVYVEIEDYGSGISPTHLPHVFEPFFTTKPVGQGKGLGLAVSYGIITDHGGTIEVDSEPGRGSVFCVRIPLKRA